MKNIIFLFVLASLSLLSCSKETTPDKNIPEINTKHKSLVAASNDFGLDLYKTTVQNESEDANIILSPLSVSMAFSMLINGAEGNTKTDILNTLHLGIDETESNQTCRDLLDFLPNVDNNVQCDIANSIWYRNGFNVLQEFIDDNQQYLDAEVQGLDFENPNAKDIINEWVYNNTNQKIDGIIDEVRPDHVMFLINAIYFNAAWNEEFETQHTYQSNFTTNNGNQVPVDMMHSSAIDFGYYQNNNVEVVDLPYGNTKKYHFTAILPNGNNTISQLSNQINMTDVNNWVADLETGHGLTIDMPKFELEYEKGLKQILSDMGMGIIFNPDADFSGIDGARDLAVSDVRHKTYMKVNEEGTEAAAVTSIDIVVTSLPAGVYINRPFILLIREETTGAILFIGRINNPTE